MSRTLVRVALVSLVTAAGLAAAAGPAAADICVWDGDRRVICIPW